MRFDSVGLFWEDAAKVKPPKKEKPVRIPPEPTWLLPEYLPHLAEAQALTIDPFDNASLTHAAAYKTPIIFDVESYPNYWMCSFKCVATGKVAIFERSLEFGFDFDSRALLWMLKNLRLVGFNSNNYDFPICTMAAAGLNEDHLQLATQQLIILKRQPWMVMRDMKVKKLYDVDHIDLMGLTALRPSLKKIAGRLHSHIMQDLPFPPGIRLSYEQMEIIRWYNITADLHNTTLLWNDCQEELEYRIELGETYNMDLRSHANPAVAESVISKMVCIERGIDKISRVKLDDVAGTTFQFKMPKYIKYRSRTMQAVKKLCEEAIFEIGEDGYVHCDALNKFTVKIAGTTYAMGLGGLHSRDKKAYYVSDTIYTYKDKDVTSYYPFLMLNSGQYPIAMGGAFRPVFAEIVDTRVTAKKAGQTKKEKGLKIVINSGFGKTGNLYSDLFGPEFMVQTTLSGQLALLMLVEALEMVSIHVVSANTDGIVIQVPNARSDEVEAIIKDWEVRTGLNMEETIYAGIYIRDVNNYVAIYKEPQKGSWFKGKGIWCQEDREHDPKYRICIDAGVKLMTEGIPIEKTIRECNDIRKFVYVGYSKFGCVKDGEYLGKVARWYMPLEKHGEVIDAKKGHLVANGAGVKPLMMMDVNNFPDDVDKDWYIENTYSMLKDIQFIRED